MERCNSILCFKFDDFEGLPSEPDEAVLSKEQTDCNGNIWQLVLYPGGKSLSRGDDNDGESLTLLSVYLINKGKHDKQVKYSFILRNASGLDENEHQVRVGVIKGGRELGTNKFIKRSFVLDKTNNVLFKGSLIIDVDIQN